MPHSLVRAYAAPDETVGESPLRADATLFLVTRRPAPPELAGALPTLRRDLGLAAPTLSPDGSRERTPGPDDPL